MRLETIKSIISQLMLRIKLIVVGIMLTSCAVPILLALFPGINPAFLLPAATFFAFPRAGGFEVPDRIVVPFESFLTSIAVTPDRSKLYVCDGLNNTVSVIDTSINEVINIVPVGSAPNAIAITPNGSKAYVVNSESNSVSVIDVETNRVIATVRLNASPNPKVIAITPNGTKAYVSHTIDDDGLPGNEVSVIDVETNSLITEIVVGEGPLGIGFTPDGSKAYVANSFFCTDTNFCSVTEGTVSVIDVQSDKVLTTVTV